MSALKRNFTRDIKIARLQSALVGVRDAGRKLCERTQFKPDLYSEHMALMRAIQESEKVQPPIGLETTLKPVNDPH